MNIYLQEFWSQKQLKSKFLQGQKFIDNILKGFNSNIFCYGQTGSGKIYIICGNDNLKERGIIQRLLIAFF